MYRVNFIPTKRRARTTKNGHHYDHPENIREAARIVAAYTGEKYDCPVVVSIETFGRLPKSMAKRIETSPNTVKPDVDNTAKAILDALNGVAYTDDRLVVSLKVIKHDRQRIKQEYTLFDVRADESSRSC